MSNMVNISALIPEELEKVLNQVSQNENRERSYYVKKGLENFFKQRQQALQLENNLELSLQQIENGDCHEVTESFWQTLKTEIVEEIKSDKKV